jgi:hypothetical protein
MILRVKHKGSKVLLEKDELRGYMDKKLQEINSLASSVVTALLMVSLIVVVVTFRAGDIYFYLLIIVPLVARPYLGGLTRKWLGRQFKELLEI